MKLDAKDIDALSKSRVNRLEGNKQMYWLVGVAVAMLVGIFLVQNTFTYPGYGLALVAFIAYIWNMNTLTKKQKVMKVQLMMQWEIEQVATKEEIIGKDAN